MKYLYIVLLSLITVNCGSKVAIEDPIPNHETFKIESKQIGEIRVINVWTPPSYASSNALFPVLYMPDGGINEDFSHIANTIAKLIENKSIPPIILVGIENTKRGRDLTGFSETKEDEKYCPLTDGAKIFRLFITKELFKEIEKRYRITSKKGIIGESLAGLFVMETFMQHPESFDYYIAFDPSLWWNNHYLVRNAENLFNAIPNKPIKLWFTGSNTQDISQYTNPLASILETHSPKKLQWTYSYQPSEKHSTIFRATKEEALLWIFHKEKE